MVVAAPVVQGGFCFVGKFAFFKDLWYFYTIVGQKGSPAGKSLGHFFVLVDMDPVRNRGRFARDIFVAIGHFIKHLIIGIGRFYIVRVLFRTGWKSEISPLSPTLTTHSTRSAPRLRSGLRSLRARGDDTTSTA